MIICKGILLYGVLDLWSIYLKNVELYFAYLSIIGWVYIMVVNFKEVMFVTVINSSLVIDLGNSETRIKTICGVNSNGTRKSKLSVCDNRYATVTDEELRVFLSEDNYTDENSSIFMLNNGTFYCNGDVCSIEKGETCIRPTALEKKYETLVTKLTIINAFRQGFIDTSELCGIPLSELNVDWELNLMLPPGDINMGAPKLADMAKKITSINFLIPKMEKPIRIKKVNVFPEGLCAFFGVVFESKGKIRQGYKHLVDPLESTLILDIGAGTTDILLARGGQVVQNSRYTKEIGGNNIHRIVQRRLKEDGISLPDRVVRTGVNQGYIKSGSRSIDISKYIEEAKERVSRQLVDGIQEFFESSMISVRTISNVLVCGGGAEVPENENLKPVSEYILSYMKSIAPDVRLVDMPKVQYNGAEMRISPRLLNITGAGILAA